MEPERRVKSLFFATMFPQIAVTFMTATPPVMAREIAGSIGLGPEAAGYFTGLLYASVLAGNLVSAQLIGLLGPLRLSFAGVASAGLGLALFGTGGSVLAMVIAAILIGFSYGPLTPASAQVIAGHARPGSLNLFISIRQTAVPLGVFLAGLVTPSLLLRLGWQETCQCLGLGFVLLSALLSFGLPLVRGERPAGTAFRGFRIAAPLLIIVRRADLLTLASASVVYGAVQLILTAFLVAFLTAVVGHDLVTAGFLLGVSQIAGVVGRILWGGVADRIARPRRLLCALGVATAVSCGLTAGLAALGPTALSLPVVVLFGLTASGWNGVFLAEVMRAVSPGEAGIATSGSLLFTYGGIIVGPPVFGALAGHVGFATAFVVAGCAVLVGAVLADPPGRLARR